MVGAQNPSSKTVAICGTIAFESGQTAHCWRIRIVTFPHTIDSVCKTPTVIRVFCFLLVMFVDNVAGIDT